MSSHCCLFPFGTSLRIRCQVFTNGQSIRYQFVKFVGSTTILHRTNKKIQSTMNLQQLRNVWQRLANAFTTTNTLDNEFATNWQTHNYQWIDNKKQQTLDNRLTTHRQAWTYNNELSTSDKQCMTSWQRIDKLKKFNIDWKQYITTNRDWAGKQK